MVDERWSMEDRPIVHQPSFINCRSALDPYAPRLNAMRPIATQDRRAVSPWFLLALLASPALAQDESKTESAYVKLLKKAPEGRMAQIIDLIGKRGTADDLAFVYDRATAPDGFPDSVRLKALEALDDAALNRQLHPKIDIAAIGRLIKTSDPKADPAVRLAAIKLAGAWKAEPTVADLHEIAGSKQVASPTRAAAFEALASIGGIKARAAIDALASPERMPSVQALAVAALARFDVGLAAEKAAGALTDDARIEDVTPLIAAFLDRQGGGDKLAAALEKKKPTADGARLALRAVYALGRADESLIAVLSKSAGLEAEPKLPTKEQMDALVAEVATKGDSDRGETIFRRAELNCIKCHAISGAGGGVGPDLSALGLSSPVDYVVNSILIPDQAIKEEFQTRMVVTDDGRVLQGIVIEEDDKRLVLKDATGERRVVPIASIEESKKSGSLMPKGLSSLLTRAEFVDLVRFLSELGKPGPYAIRSTPTIQRWRVLNSAVDDIDDVLKAEPAQWLPAYSKVAGALPLEEIASLAPGKTLFLQGEITVSAAGPVVFRINSTRGLTGWLDDQPLPPGDAPSVEVVEGTHRLTLRIDVPSRDRLPIRVEVTKPEGSSTEFSVVGGR
jgi:putative heme-binding domain-containing protein